MLQVQLTSFIWLAALKKHSQTDGRGGAEGAESLYIIPIMIFTWVKEAELDDIRTNLEYKYILISTRIILSFQSISVKGIFK